MKVLNRPVIAFCKIDQNFVGYPQSGDTTDYFLKRFYYHAFENRINIAYINMIIS